MNGRVEIIPIACGSASSRVHRHASYRLIGNLEGQLERMNEFTNSHTGDAMTPCDRLLTDARYEGTRGGRATGEALFAARLARHLVRC